METTYRVLFEIVKQNESTTFMGDTLMDRFQLPVKYSETYPSIRKLVREQYIEEQDGLCQFCKKPLTGNPSKKVLNAFIDLRLFPKNFLNHPIHLHHCRKTDLTIGAVHARCNGYLWQYLGE